MLIYNSQKEFIGIDEEDLRALGFNNLADLQIEATDFSDLFLRTPGYIHNFKYVHWIDYISFGGSLDTPKAIIHTQKADFSCTLSISKFFVSDSPASDAYGVHLNNIKRLTQQESAQLAEDISQKATPQALDESMIPEPLSVDVEKIQSSIAQQNALFAGEDFSYENKETDLLKEELLQIPDDEPLTQKPQVETITIDETPITLPEEVEPQIAVEEEKLDIVIDEAPEEPFIVEESPKEDIEPLTEPKVEVEPEPLIIEEVTQEEIVQETSEETDIYKNDYIYNPQVASDELGLPIDLIEEFIEDFIAQAKEFKDELYKAIDEEDINNLRILSHKLKGVAANLRIEDALEVLVIVNTSDDLKLVKTNLNYFYQIIHKLDNNEQVEDEIAEKLVVKDEEDFVLDFKDSDETQKTSNSGYDKEKVANEIGLDMDTFNDLFNDYIIDAEDLLHAMQKLIESDDLIHLKKHIVKLEGMNKNMRVDSFSKELQTLLDTPNQEVAREALAKINTQISSMKD